MEHVHGPAPFPPHHARAFAEGRRLRDGSRMRPYVPPPPMRRRPGPGRVLLPFLLVPVGFFMFSVLTALFGILALLGVVSFAAVPLIPLFMVGTASFAITRQVRRNAVRRGRPVHTGPFPAPRATPPRPDVAWGQARRRFGALRTAYAAYECDAMAVLRLPALADVSVPSTARFVDAFAEAQALDTDAFPGPSHAVSYVTAVERAERCWRAANEAAERIRLAGLSPAERSTVERVIKLLTTARDSDSDAERVAAYARARSELAKLDRAGVVHVPLPAQAVLDAASRGQLPA